MRFTSAKTCGEFGEAKLIRMQKKTVTYHQKGLLGRRKLT